MTASSIVFRPIVLVAVLVMTTCCWSSAMAYDTWSQNGGDATNCGACHGDFRANSYISNTDGMNWGNLHNLHRQDMLNGDCDTCHMSTSLFPVLLTDSDGGNGLDSISCMGCHGRAEDHVPANPEFAIGLGGGYGAGLRQQHFVANVTVCQDCHLDADPLSYTPVGEEVLPPYYADPGINHPNIPNSSCNDDGSENFAGSSAGLDNDGDGAFDATDGDCNITAVPPIAWRMALLRNSPNPFNPTTKVSYIVSNPGWVRVRVFDGPGKLVRTLVDADHAATGEFSVLWNGRDAKGLPLPSGVYFCRLDGSDAIEVRKMVLVK